MLFSFFQNVDFMGYSGAKRAKNANFYLYISGTVDHIIKIFSTQV